MKRFSFAILVSLLCLGVAFGVGYARSGFTFGLQTLLIAAVLGVMELSLSFDNAVINASILERMAPVWRRRFLTWGILIAVMGMRLVLPIAIVALVARLDLFSVVALALNQPELYARELTHAHVPISAFGGCFLLLAALEFLCDPDKEVHWLAFTERPLAQVGAFDRAALLVTLGVLLAAVYLLVPGSERLVALSAGLVGILLQSSLSGLSSLFDAEDALRGRAQGGALAFIYLELLDASFSLDGVIGAFAITRDVIVIAAGLAIGAVFVRSLTLLMVDAGSLSRFVFLEHGAHYAIAALACIMLISMSPAVEIPEVMTGLIGVAFISLAIGSSVRRNQALSQQV